MGGILRRLFPGWRPEPPRPDGHLTWAEIEQKYPGEWVLLDAPTHDRRWAEVTGGRLVLHTPDIEDFNTRVLDHRTPRMAALYVFSGSGLRVGMRCSGG